ncbi:MAG: ComF family protein [Candidatus Desulfaltia sp.]|nr:ComF family protein [Candidatus Desulfaltia sp.]
MVSNKAKHLIRTIIAALQEAVFPTRCLVCKAFLESRQQKSLSQDFEDNASFNCRNRLSFQNLMTEFLCPTCIKGFIPVKPPMCPVCGIMFKSREGEDHVCGECLTSPKRFRISRSPGIYDREFMAVIHCLKYKGKIQLARPLGILLFSAFISFWGINSIDIIVPVPLHIKRFRKRGFNQAYLLVRDWKRIAENLNIDLSNIKIDKDVLIRNRWTDPQTGLDRKKRMTNIKNAFSVNDQAVIKNKRILLVDDVYTTGATANECAKTLLSGKAEYVDVLTLARAM